MSNTENKPPAPEKPKRAWWEIPARCAVLFVIIPVFFPLQWYRAAYVYTIGRFFPVTVESKMAEVEKKVQKHISLKEMPVELRILVLKREKQVELWGKFSNGKWKKLNYYVILAITEDQGPKIHKDDKKTPEGIYDISSMDLNTPYYLAVNLKFPSEADIAIAKNEGRDPETLNGRFMIHGIAFTRNNIMLSNGALDEIFYMLAKVGLSKAKILILPYDFRKYDLPGSVTPEWIQARYKLMKDEMLPLKEDKENNNAETGKN